jgi:Zn-dependent M16 (insulinase) family peptidase
MTYELPKDFIESNEYCVIEPGLTSFNKDQIITHADLMKHLENNDINTISVLPHLSNVETLQEKVSKLLDDTEEKMNDLIEEYNESIEDDEDLSEINTTDLSYKFSELNDYIEDYS